MKTLKCFKSNVKLNKWRTYGGGGSSNPLQGKKKKWKIVLLLMTCNKFVVSLLRFELKIYNYTNIMIIK
jgi:hypothetical protein